MGTDGPSDQPTNQRTDKVSYRVTALPRLKIDQEMQPEYKIGTDGWTDGQNEL